VNRAFIILVTLAALTGFCYVLQKSPEIITEGLYPVVRDSKSSFTFNSDSIDITLHERSATDRIAVFAYDAENRQVVIIKPVQDSTKIVVRPGDSADYQVSLEGDEVRGSEILREVPGVSKSVDFFQLLVEARAASRRYGVQDCLYPFCTRCMDVCPVIKQGVIKMKIDKSGAFYPAIHLTGCPRSGKCFAVCRVGAILSVSTAAKDGISTRPAE
jgi:ferredoxin